VQSILFGAERRGALVMTFTRTSDESIRERSQVCGAWTTTTWTGKKEHRKDVAELMLAHGIPYVATTSASYLMTLYYKVKRAKDLESFRYIEILSPCPPGWRHPMDETVKIGKLAVQTGMWILYECDDRHFRLTGFSKAIAEGRRKMKNVEEYLFAQERFSHLSEGDIAKLRSISRKGGHV
jgi:pyruvate ferredoxin oxidoreductase beta subunit